MMVHSRIRASASESVTMNSKSATRDTIFWTLGTRLWREPK
jgi:hypothetical protein